jgi:putative ABC transport system permease protein
LSVAARTALPQLARTLAEEVRSVHARTLVSDVFAVDEQVDAALVSERLFSTLATALAVLAIGLAALGLHGLLSDAVARRRAEFGVRMALGAAPSDVAWSVYREVIGQVLAGIAVGVPLALAITPRAEVLLYGVTATEPSAYVLSAALIVAVAAMAGGVAARRAWRIAPSEALRQG